MNWTQVVSKTVSLLPHGTFDRWLLIFSVTACILVLAFLVGLAIFDQRKSTLTRLIWNEKRKMFGYRFYYPSALFLRNLYDPSLGSVAAILLLVAAAWGGISRFQSGGPPSSAESSLIARLQTLDAGIALVFVPFTIFAVGLSSRRTESAINTAEVLLKETFIFPITVVVLSLLTSFIVVRRPIIGELVVLTTLWFAIFAIFRLCRVLLDEERLASSAASLLQDKIRHTIGIAMNERIGRNLLLSRLDNQPLEYSISRSVLGGGFFRISSARQGIVRDVYLDRLFDFARELEIAANEQGYSFDQRQDAKDAVPQTDQEMKPVNVSEFQQDRRRYILKLFGDQVSDRSACLVSFPRSLVQDAARRDDLKRQVQSAFVIKAGDTYSDRVERYLGLMKDEAIAAIRDRRTAYLQNLLDSFELVAVTFADEMKKAIGGHSFESAMNERQTLFGGWNEMKWISRHLLEIHYRGCRSDDIYIARMVAVAPLAIAYRLLSQRDALVFDQFTSFFYLLYNTLDDVPNLKVRKLLLDTCDQYAKDIGLGIAIELERPENNEGDLERIKSFATVLLVRYVELLKLSFDKRNNGDFHTFKDAMWGFLGHLGSRLTRQTAVLRTTETPETLLDEDRASLAKEQSRRKAVVGVLETIEQEKQQAFFAIGSYVFSIASDSDQSFADYLTEIDAALTISVEGLHELYVGTQRPEGQQIWTRAFYQDAPGGMWDQSAGTEYFSYLLLKSTFRYAEKEFSELVLPSDPGFVSEIRKEGQISVVLTSFLQEREKWRKMVPDAWLPAIPKLQQVFAQATAQRMKSDEDAIIQSPVDERYLREFRQRFVKEFDANATLRQIFRTYRAYSDESDVVLPTGAAPKWGLNVLDLRQAYTSQGYQGYAQWPEEYARKLATSESESVFHRILHMLPELDLREMDGLDAQIAAVARELEKRNLRPSVLLVAWQSRLATETLELEQFTPRWLVSESEKQPWGFLGEISLAGRKVPVFAISNSSEDASFGCAIALPSSFLWRQLSPTDNAGEFKDRQDYFHIPIVDLANTPGVMSQIMADNPVWLQAQADKQRYLSLRVWLRISERFEIDALDPILGFKFNLAQRV
jgi:hypothetical protein